MILQAICPGSFRSSHFRPTALVLSAVKRSEDGEALIVRCYNPTAEALTAALDTCWPVEQADLVSLDEEPLAEAPTVEPARIRFAIGAKQVRTVAVRFARHPLSHDLDCRSINHGQEWQIDMKFVEEHNAEAQAAWDAFNAGRAVRPPVAWARGPSSSSITMT